MNEKENPNYYGIIPAEVRYSKCSANSKLLYSEITALSNLWGFCKAGNEYFAKLYDVHKNTISAWVSELADAGFIEIFIENGNQRKIYLCELRKPILKKADAVSEKTDGVNEIIDPVNEKAEGGSGKAERHNITFNNTSNTKLNKEEKSSLPTDSMEAKWLKSFTSENANRDIDRAIKETYSKEISQTDFFQVYSEFWQDYNKRTGAKVLVNINYATRLWAALKYDDRESILREMRQREESYFNSYWWNKRKRPFTQQELVEFWDQLASVKKEETKTTEKINSCWDPKDETRVREILEALKGRAYDDPQYDILNNEKKQIINKYAKPK